MEKFKTYTTSIDDLRELKTKSMGERLSWIREKANEKNKSMFTMYRVADQTGIAQSTIGRIESGEVKNPQLPKIEKIAEYLGVNMEVLFDDYYKGKLKEFIICESKNATNIGVKEDMHLDVMDVAYQVEVQANITSVYSHNQVTSFNETIEITPLEYEELLDELSFLINKVKKRRTTWRTKINASERLSNKGDKNE